MKIPISTIRIPPRRPKTIRRHRLLDLIHQNIQRKLIFLCAPAGYGKTTLLVDTAGDTDATVAWCRIGSDDESLAYFFKHIILAIREMFPEFGQGLDGIDFQESALQPRTLAIELVNAIATSLEDFTLLVLDDYHVISANLPIVAFIEHFLELLPDQIRLIIGSRSIYGIPSASLYINEELAVINADDLRFRIDEVKDLALRRFQIHLTDQQAEEITSQSEGWVMSILLGMRDWNSAAGLPKVAGAREQVYQYLAREIYNQLPTATRSFLLQTSVCDQFNIPFANHILGIDHARKTVKDLEDSNLFIFPVRDGGGTAYQYHQLFRDFLLAQFRESPTLEQAGVHKRIAAWYESHGDPVKSIRHYLDAGEEEAAAGIMDAQARSLYISGQEEVLDNWFRVLSGPPDRRHLAPDLLLNWVKVKTNQGKMEGCLELLDIAEPVFTAQGRFDNLANLLVVRGMILRFRGEFEKAIEIARRTQALVEEKRLDLYYSYQAGRLEGLGLFHTGHQEPALVSIHTALQGFRDLNKTRPSDRLKHDLIMVLTDLGMMSLLTGDTFNAEGSFEEALSISLSLRGNIGDLASCANNRAYLAFLMGDYPQAWKYYEQALAAAEQADWTRTIVQVLNGQAELLTYIDEVERAEVVLQRALKVAQSVPGGRISPATYQELAELEKLNGNYSQALGYLRQAAHLSNTDPKDPDYQVRVGSVYISMQEWQIAQETLLSAIQNFKETRPSQSRSLGHYYLAEIFYCLGKKQTALEYFQKALSEAARLGHDTFLVNVIRRSPEVAQEMAKAWNNNHLTNLLHRAAEYRKGVNLWPSHEDRPTEPARYSLQIKALGDFEIRRDKELLPSAIWKSAGARALFFYILDRGRVKREDLSLVFWPEFSNAKVNSNFHATLWRVRNAIGKKDVIAFDGQYYSIDGQAEIYYDVREFEGLFSRLENSSSSDSERRSLYTQAIDLFGGDFLADIDMPWTDTRRAELREKYLFLLEQFAEFEYENRHLREARRLFEKAIEIDPYQDHLHLKLMKCLVDLKMASSAKKHFENYRKTLTLDLGNEPMPELQAFAKTIK
jgi:LuxR family transcriptional regulator, maltose regulon positive regulatory protein